MNSFNYYSPTRFVFGKGEVSTVGAYTKGQNVNKVLVVYGSAYAERSGLLSRVTDSLKAEGLEIVLFGGVKANPMYNHAVEGVELAKKEKVDFVLAVGGGSTIDTAKAIAVGAVDDGLLWDFYSRARMPKKALPLGVVLTIPAAGSEGSGNSVLTHDESLLKRSATGECMRPRFSILDPELTYSLSLYQSACGIVDMMAHIFERYFTQTKDVDLTDQMCEAVLRSIVNAGSDLRDNLEKSKTDAGAAAKVAAARDTLMWAGTVAHVNILGLGRVEDWSVHALEHEMSALYDVAHGAGLAITYPHWMRYQLQFTKLKFVQLATRVFGVEPKASEDETALEGIQELSDFWTSLGMPQRLTEIEGFKECDIKTMARKAKRVRPGELGNFHPLNDAQVEEVYRTMI